MGFVGWVAIYFLAAWLFGFWPFEEGVFTGPTSECSYDSGYDDGYDGALPKCKLNAYLEGYEEGNFDSECHWLRCEKPNYEDFNRLGCGSWTAKTCY